jgi:hypothetical protein
MRDGDLSLGDSGLGEEFGSVNYTAALGRISGKLLNPDLVRNGVDLTFRNYTSDPDILYLDVTNKRIGINTATPVYALDVNAVIKTTKLEATNQARIGNVIANGPSSFTTVVGALQILPADTHIPIPFHRITTANLEFRANMIGSLSNSNIVLDPNGSGTVELQATTNVTGNVVVTGNIAVTGNVAGAGTITIGDQTTDVVSISPDLTQSIVPGADNTFDFGSSSKKWANAYIPDWKQVNNLAPYRINVNDQTLIDGVDNKISGVQLNDDINISPDSGITQIEQLRFSNGTITNLVNSGLTGTPGILSIYNPGLGYTDGVAVSLAGTRFNITTIGGSVVTLSAVDNIAAYSGQGAFALIQGTASSAQFTVSGYVSTNPMTFAGTGTGYLQFTGTGAISLPSGPTAQRPANPEVGDTRWNTDLQFMECFDGSTYIIATGPGETINRAKMEELGNIWTLILA